MRMTKNEAMVTVMTRITFRPEHLRQLPRGFVLLSQEQAGERYNYTFNTRHTGWCPQAAMEVLRNELLGIASREQCYDIDGVPFPNQSGEAILELMVAGRREEIVRKREIWANEVLADRKEMIAPRIMVSDPSSILPDRERRKHRTRRRMDLIVWLDIYLDPEGGLDQAVRYAIEKRLVEPDLM